MVPPEPIAYAAIAKDRIGLYYFVREKHEIRRIPDIVTILKGPIEDVMEKAEQFIQANKGKDLKSLTDQEITDLL